MSEILPWLNVLLIPAVGLLVTINSRLARLEAVQDHHAARLEQIDGIRA